MPNEEEEEEEEEEEDQPKKKKKRGLFNRINRMSKNLYDKSEAWVERHYGPITELNVYKYTKYT